MSGAQLRLGIAGLGVVGSALLEQLRRPHPRLDGRLSVSGVCARQRHRPGRTLPAEAVWFDDPVALAASPAIEVFVELIGGSDGPAKAAVETALQHGKAVVTANKALLAEHGAALAALAQARGGSLAFEAAVAGGVPVIRALRDGLAGAEVRSIAGILNGTSNYLLSSMEAEQRDFADVLKDAQRLGYAEADPFMDVSGSDARHKLSILAAIAFHGDPAPGAMRLDGLERVSLLDIASARRLGYRIKPLAKAELTPAGVRGAVGPALLPLRHPLSQVDGALNAVVIEAEPIGRLSFIGPGAGGGATAAAVLSDLVDLLEGVRRPAFGSRSAAAKLPEGAEVQAVGRYYIRVWVEDRPGTLAAVSRELGLAEVSIESFHQDSAASGLGLVPIFLTTQPCPREALDAALAGIARLPAVGEPPLALPIEGAGGAFARGEV